MSLKLYISGQGYVGFNSIKVNKTFLNLVSEFEATFPFTQDYQQYLSKSNNSKYPIILNSKVIIENGSTKVFTGYIEKIKIVNNNQGRYISVSGRSLTQDIIDSTIDNSIANLFSGTLTLKKIIENVLEKMNITGVNVLEDGGSTQFSKDDEITPTIGTSVHDFIKKYCDKKQVYLNTTGDGNLKLIKATQNTNIPNKLLSIVGSSNNNILESNVEYDSTKEFYKYNCYSQSNSNYLSFNNISEYNNSQSSIMGTSVNDTIRRSRIFNFLSQNSLTTKEATDRAEWQSNFNNSQSVIYKCKVAGLTYDGDITWDTNLLVSINDTFCDINAIMLSSEVELVQDNNGLITNLTFVNKDSFNLIAVQNANSILRQQTGKYLTDR